MSAPADQTAAPKLPKTFKAFVAKFPVIAECHETVAHAVENVGPMDRKACELVKIGISLGAGLESATKSHVRKALEAGASETEIEQAILLGMNTCGFPSTVAAWRWAQDQFERNRREAEGG
ncbi:MAG: carboxymuconolactone decarboxylase family protein [Phycisphaerales bacterium JB038]